LKKLLNFFFVLLSFNAQAQVFSGTGGAIMNLGQDTYFDIAVSGLSPSLLDNTFGLKTVCININHPAVEELYIYLKSPAGNIVQLTAGNSCSGANYTNTCFDSYDTASITTASAPFTGSFKPIGYLGRFNNLENGNGTWSLVVHDDPTYVNSGNVIDWSISFGNSPPPLVSFSSSNLPIVVINTSQPVSEADLTADMGIINNTPLRNYITDTWNNYNGKVNIHFRGHSSLNYEKKSYTIETRDALGNNLNIPILGMPPENDWVLVAEYADKTLMRNPLTLDLSRQMGHYASRYQYVEVLLNNEYQGVYILAEKPKRDSQRINISKLDSIGNSFPAITGGYILQIDRPDQGGWFSLFPGDSPGAAHFFYQQIYPKDTDITTSQKNYIIGVMDNFETVMQSPGFADLQTGYPSLLDVNSFIDFFIINELSKNIDGYRLSTYLFKDNISAGGKIHIGPVWDYDIAWHNCNYGNSFAPEYWQYQLSDSVYPAPTWWARFLTDTNFVNKLNCRWLDLRSNTLSLGTLNTYIDAMANRLSEAQPRNFTQWPELGAYIWPNPQVEAGADYTSEITDLKDWLSSRLAWMDANITGSGLCGDTTTTGPTDNNAISTYPNPFMNDFTVQYSLPEDSRVRIELVNMIGEQLAVFYDGDKIAGTHSTSISSSSLAAGMYFLRITIGSTVSNKRIVKVELK
jgi:hypothetical protein